MESISSKASVSISVHSNEQILRELRDLQHSTADKNSGKYCDSESTVVDIPMDFSQETKSDEHDSSVYRVESNCNAL